VGQRGQLAVVISVGKLRTRRSVGQVCIIACRKVATSILVDSVDLIWRSERVEQAEAEYGGDNKWVELEYDLDALRDIVTTVVTKCSP
jgi:hypothetical protein